jgi:hypothetical protein
VFVQSLRFFSGSLLAETKRNAGSGDENVRNWRMRIVVLLDSTPGSSPFFGRGYREFCGCIHLYVIICTRLLMWSTHSFMHFIVTYLLKFIHIHSFIHSDSFIHSLTDSLTHLLTHSIIHLFTHSLTHSLTRSLIHSFILSFSHLVLQPFTHSHFPLIYYSFHFVSIFTAIFLLLFALIQDITMNILLPFSFMDR